MAPNPASKGSSRTKTCLKIGCCGGFCCCCFAMILCVVTPIGVIGALAWIARTETFGSALNALDFRPGVATTRRQIRNDEVEKELPLPPEYYPHNLRGIFWMDQSGSFAHSDIPMGAPDLAFTFAEPAVKWEPRRKTITVDVSSHCWQWFNRIDGFITHAVLKSIGFRYYFEFNHKFDFAQIYPTAFWGLLKVPKWLMSFTMVKQHPDPEHCPPKQFASKKEVAQCADWDRVSSTFLSPYLGEHGVLHYYVFQIVDPKGKRVQPAYDAYLDFANHHSQPLTGSMGAMVLGVNKEGYSFVGAKNTTRRRDEL